MSYTGEVRKSAFASFGAAASGLLVAGVMGAVGFIKSVARRRHLVQLGEFDDHMLKDIGLTRADLRDAGASPFWQDPTAALVVRAVERRASRKHVAQANLRLVSSQPQAPARSAPQAPEGDLAKCG